MNKELLFKPRLPESDVEVPGVGTVRVRGLSRAEALLVRDAVDRAKGEQKILSLAMVDPKLTEAEVAAWQSASVALEIEAVTDKIMELSGMSESAAKEAVKEFEANPDSEFRPLLGGEVESDGSRTSGNE